MTKYRKEFAKEVKERQARTDLRELVGLGYLRGGQPNTYALNGHLHESGINRQYVACRIPPVNAGYPVDGDVAVGMFLCIGKVGTLPRIIY